MPQLAVILHLEPPPTLADADFAAWWAAVAEPLLMAVAAHATPVGLVIAGPLLGWLSDTRPQSMEMLHSLVQASLVELVATPFHGPVLSAIPADDATDQVLAHLTLVRRLLDARPNGAWLPRQIWDPTVPRIFGRADITWTVVEDAAIAAFHPERGLDPWGAWRTEREGHGIVLLANDSGAMALRGVTAPEELVVMLTGRGTQGAEQLVCAWDVARRGKDEEREVAWLVEMLASLAASDITVVLPSAVASQVRGRVYIPSWAPEGVPVPWERQLLRSPEADRLHKRMLRVSRQLSRLGKRIRRNDADAPDPDQVIQARRYLHRAQGAAHYEPAGIGHPHLRHRAWRDLLRAEDVAEHAAGTHRRLVAESLDLGTGTGQQVLLRTPSLTAVVDPEQGGGLTELGVFPAAMNLIDPQMKEGRPSSAAFTEHFPHPETPMATLHDRGAPVSSVAEVVAVERAGDAAVRAMLVRDLVLADDDGPHRLRLSKAYSARVASRLDVLYELQNLGDGAIRTRFAVEIPLTVGVSPDQLELTVGPHRSPATHALEYPEVQSLAITGGPMNIVVGLQKPGRVWVFPAPLGVTVWAEWPLEIWSQEASRVKVKLEFATPESLDDDDDGVPMKVMEEPLKVGDTMVLQRPRPRPEDQRQPAHLAVQRAAAAAAASAPAAPKARGRRRRLVGDVKPSHLNLVPPKHMFRPSRPSLYAPPRPRQQPVEYDVPEEADDVEQQADPVGEE